MHWSDAGGYGANSVKSSPHPDPLPQGEGVILAPPAGVMQRSPLGAEACLPAEPGCAKVFLGLEVYRLKESSGVGSDMQLQNSR